MCFAVAKPVVLEVDHWPHVTAHAPYLRLGSFYLNPDNVNCKHCYDVLKIKKRAPWNHLKRCIQRSPWQDMKQHIKYNDPVCNYGALSSFYQMIVITSINVQKCPNWAPKCQYFVWPPLFSSTALTLLGTEFTSVSQVATGVLFHSSMTTSRSWWMLETLLSSTFCLRMPHRCLIGFRSGDMLGQSITFTLSFFSKVVVVLEVCLGSLSCGILPCGPVSEGRGSCSASVCHSTCWHSWQHSCSPRPWHSHHHAWL